jgi:hypothetical protein
MTVELRVLTLSVVLGIVSDHRTIACCEPSARLSIAGQPQ